jgi:hypothetical protein
MKAYRPVGHRFIGGGLPGFKWRMIFATFHCAGKYPVSMVALNICV